MARTQAIDTSKVIFTKHSVARFTKRYKKMHPKNPLIKPAKTLREYLARAVVDDTISERKKNEAAGKHGAPCIYLRFRAWRFRIVEKDGELHLVTVIDSKRK